MEGHQVITDEPKKAGGSDTGPTPLQTVLAALAGCEQATATYIAKEMGINLKSITFNIEGEFDARGFLAVEGVPARFQKVKVNARVQTDASQQQIDELAKQVHRRCPVACLFHCAGVQMDATWTKA
jgi:putative redox protein